MTVRDWFMVTIGALGFAVVVFAWLWAGVVMFDWMVRP